MFTQGQKCSFIIDEKHFGETPIALKERYSSESIGILSDRGNASWKPPLDIRENAECFVVELELPGINSETLVFETGENFLMVQGEKMNSSSKSFEASNRLERGYGHFERLITLPVKINQNRVDTVYENGVLNITLPKKEASPLQAIEINFIN